MFNAYDYVYYDFMEFDLALKRLEVVFGPVSIKIIYLKESL